MKHRTRRAAELLREEGFFELVRETKIRVSMRTLSRSTVLPYSAHFKVRTAINYWLNRIRYDAPARPYEAISVDPDDVQYYVQPITDERELGEQSKGLGQILAGDWDQRDNLRPIEDHPTVKGLTQRFVEGRAWEETGLYKVERKRIEEKGSSMGYTSPEQFLDVRCAFVDELFASIRDDGYRPNFEAEHETPEIDARSTGRLSHYRLEPLVVIGRTGDIHWQDGFHRFAIADILGIDSIPVNVLCRHERWQRLRDAVHNGGLPDRSPVERTHPDLQDLV